MTNHAEPNYITEAKEIDSAPLTLETLEMLKRAILKNSSSLNTTTSPSTSAITYTHSSDAYFFHGRNANNRTMIPLRSASIHEINKFSLLTLLIRRKSHASVEMNLKSMPSSSRKGSFNLSESLEIKFSSVAEFGNVSWLKNFLGDVKPAECDKYYDLMQIKLPFSVTGSMRIVIERDGKKTFSPLWKIAKRTNTETQHLFLSSVCKVNFKKELRNVKNQSSPDGKTLVLFVFLDKAIPVKNVTTRNSEAKIRLFKQSKEPKTYHNIPESLLNQAAIETLPNSNVDQPAEIFVEDF